jgi:hypothetical protein
VQGGARPKHNTRSKMRREASRLSTIFQRALLVALGVQASCSSDEPGGAIAQDGGAGSSDATVDGTGSGGDDGAATTDGGTTESGVKTDSALPLECDAAAIAIDGAAFYDGSIDDAAPGCCATGCDTYTVHPCGLDALRYLDGGQLMFPPVGCYFRLGDCSGICGQQVNNCHVVNEACVEAGAPDEFIEAGALLLIECAACSGIGRRPHGLVEEHGRRGRTALGDYFARAAHLEAASVLAFRALARDLVRHRAPRRLVKLAQRAAREEIRHARVTAKVARRHGGSPPVVRMHPRRSLRSLEAIATENAVEGCVRETFGALVATWQAANATDARIGREMRGIARDETRHASLSWALARWAEGRLSRAARARVGDARRAALEALHGEIARPLAPELVDRAGLPQREVARALLDELAGALAW